MFKNSKDIAIICGGISIAATIIFYLMTFDNIFTIPMRWISLMFLIFAEGIGTIKALNIKKSIFGISSIITSLFHLGIVLIMSIIFVNVSPLLIKKYILLNVLVLCILLVVDAVIIYFDDYIASKNKVLSENQSVIESLYTKANELSIEYKETVYKKDLEEISEMLQYTDNSTLSNDEIAILNELEELQEMLSNDDENIRQKISDVKNAVKLRSLKIKSAKRGSY